MKQIRAVAGRRLLAWALAALAAMPALARAQDLLTVWHAALERDRTLAVARADYAASQTRREQAAALGRPTVSSVLGAGWGQSSTRMNGAQFTAPGLGTSNGVDFATSVNSGLATRASIVAQYPLINLGRDASQAQLELGAGMGSVAWRAAQTELALRISERYFALAVAQERLRVTESQVKALEQAATEAHDRFELGESPITEVHEADAALASVRAQLEAARLQTELSAQTLAHNTGLDTPSARLPERSPAPGGSVQDWIDAAQAGSPQVQLAQQAVAMAGHELRRRRAAGTASLDLVAQAGQQRIDGHGSFGSSGNRSHDGSVSLQVNIPLYDGGMSGAQASEGARLLDKAQAQLDLAREQVAEQTRAAWLGWQAGQARVAALEQGFAASAARLDATRLGREVGDRTLLDVLNAENDHANATLALAEARVEQVASRLRLAALADRLDEALLGEVNAGLK
ncbi:MAG: TolC family protein [Desulfovibrionaceae bacterium]|nr:TolC family protein [Desulfovibrionaceae bacterium]